MSTERIIPFTDLPGSDISRSLEGYTAGASVSIITVDFPPGHGPKLHTHPYEELFVVLEGTASFRVGDRTVEVGPQNIVIVPPNTPHGFTNTGDGLLKQVDVHAADRFTTTWLE
jgi:quercetin dioxygenase-like cupin family protein